MTKAGRSLANTIKEVSSQIQESLDENNTLTKEEFTRILNENIRSMQDELTNEEAEDWELSMASLNILTLLLANFSVFEAYSYREATNEAKLNKMSRKKVLKKSFEIMMNSLDIVGTEEVVSASDSSQTDQ